MERNRIYELASLLGGSHKDTGQNVMFSCPNAPYTTAHKSNRDRHFSFGVQAVDLPYTSKCNCFTCGIHGEVSRVFRRLYQDGRISQEVWAFVSASEVVDLTAMRDFLHRRLDSPRVTFQSGDKNFNVGSFATQCSENRTGDRYLLERGVTDEELGKYVLGYDEYRSRVTFPIIRGKEIVGCVGRTVIEEEPKYYKYSSLDSSVLFGEQFLDPMFPGLYLVEGPLDVIMAARALRNVLALDGLALTRPQLERLLHFCRYVVLLFDGDDAGYNAVDRIGSILKPRIRTYVIDVPWGRDPGEMGPKELQDLAYCPILY